MAGLTLRPAKPPVQEVKVSKVKLAQKKYEIAKGKAVKLAKEIVSMLPANATNKKLTWVSTKPSVASVGAATGIVKVSKKKKAIKKTATIKALNADGAVVLSVKVKVMKGRVTKVKAVGKKKLTVKAGKKVTLKAAVSVAGGRPVNKKLRWTSSNPSIVKVTSKLGNKMKVKVAKKAKKGKVVKITAKSTDGTNKKIVFKIKVKK